MSDAQAVISVLDKVFGGVDLPLCIAILNSEGMEVYSTKNCTGDTEATNVLGLMAFEELAGAMKRRAQVDVDVLIFRIESKRQEYFLTPVGEEGLHMIAISEVGKIGNVMQFLEGLSSQIDHALRNM